MRARGRIGLGMAASGLIHAAATIAAVWLAGRERASGAPDHGGEWAEVELVVEDIPPAAPAARAEPQAEPAAASRSDTGPRSASELAPRSGTRSAPGTPSASDAPSTSETRSAPEMPSGLAMRSTSETRSRSETGPAPQAGPEPSPGSPRLDARRTAEVAEPDPGPPPPPQPLEPLRLRHPPRPRSELRPDGTRGFTTDEGPFVAHTDPEGSVRFEDRSSIRIHIPSPRQMAVDMARGLERWSEDPRRYTEENHGQSRLALGGTFELTDMIMRAGGQDPYAARKSAFLDRTREERMRIAAAENSRRLREALHRTRSDLERLWRGPGSAAEKRHLLFAMWDECAETGPDEVVRTGRAVRGQIVGFVRRHLPAGSRAAYTAAELARENARRTSVEPFDPYAADE
jgi:hypothetical protein